MPASPVREYGSVRPPARSPAVRACGSGSSKPPPGCLRLVLYRNQLQAPPEALLRLLHRSRRSFRVLLLCPLSPKSVRSPAARLRSAPSSRLRSAPSSRLRSAPSPPQRRQWSPLPSSQPREPCLPRPPKPRLPVPLHDGLPCSATPASAPSLRSRYLLFCGYPQTCSERCH